MNDREQGYPEAALLSTSSIRPVPYPDESVETIAVFASPAARPQVLCGRAKWTISAPNSTQRLPSWLLPSVKALVGILNLPPGWNSHSAKRIAPQNAITALGLLARLLDFQAVPPTVVPRAQGNLQLEWHTAQLDIEIYIDSPDSVRFFAGDVTNGPIAEGSLSGREEELRAWLKQLPSD